MDTLNLDNYSQRNIKNSKSMMIWSALWGGSLAAACFAFKFWWYQNELVFIIAVIIHLGCAIGALKAHQTWLKGLDELQQKIQLHSMAFTLGVTWIGITLLLLVSTSGFIKIDAFYLPILAGVMAVVGVIGNLIGLRKVS